MPAATTAESIYPRYAQAATLDEKNRRIDKKNRRTISPTSALVSGEPDSNDGHRGAYKNLDSLAKLELEHTRIDKSQYKTPRPTIAKRCKSAGLNHLKRAQSAQSAVVVGLAKVASVNLGETEVPVALVTRDEARPR